MDSINELTVNPNQNNESPAPDTTTTMPIATRNLQRPELGTATRLIELVKIYPELYDKTHPLYCNNVHKGVLWHRIADELGGTSAKKIREQFSYIRKRFKNEYEARKKGKQSRGLVPEPDAKNYRQPLYVYEQLSFLEESFEKEDLQENDKTFMKEPQLKVETAEINSAENFVNNASLTVIENSSTEGVTPKKRPRTQSPIQESSPSNETTPSSESLSSASSTTNPFDSTLFAAFMNSQLQSPPISMPMEADEECTIFGRQVAMDLQRLNVHSRVKARQRITKILLELYLKQ